MPCISVHARTSASNLYLTMLSYKVTCSSVEVHSVCSYWECGKYFITKYEINTCPPAPSSSKILDEKLIINFTWPYETVIIKHSGSVHDSSSLT